jgi:hypothetical protein
MPKITLGLLILSLVVFLGGAVGLESVSLYFGEIGKWVLWRLFLVVEEIFELVGLLIFVYALESYQSGLRNKFGFLT